MKLKEKIPCYVCDLDGTLCDVSHRRQWIATQPKNWDAWNAGISDDKLNVPVYDAISALAMAFPIILVSGRGEEYRQVTEQWLERNNVTYHELFMRKAEDFRPDDEVKSELADEVEKTYKILGVFDDRQRVVRMWRSRGIFVFDVSQGNGEF
jgi:hypothetical protein